MSDEIRDIACEEAARHLWAYLDGELDGVPAAEVRRHLGECARCTAVSAAQQRFRALVADLGERAGAGEDALRRRIEEAVRAARGTAQSGGA